MNIWHFQVNIGFLCETCFVKILNIWKRVLLIIPLLFHKIHFWTISHFPKMLVYFATHYIQLILSWDISCLKKVNIWIIFSHKDLCNTWKCHMCHTTIVTLKLLPLQCMYVSNIQFLTFIFSHSFSQCDLDFLEYEVQNKPVLGDRLTSNERP